MGTLRTEAAARSLDNAARFAPGLHENDPFFQQVAAPLQTSRINGVASPLSASVAEGKTESMGGDVGAPYAQQHGRQAHVKLSSEFG